MSIHLNSAGRSQHRRGESSTAMIASAVLVVLTAASCDSGDGAVSEPEVTSPASVDASTGTPATAGTAPATDPSVRSVVDDSIVGAAEGSTAELPTTTSTAAAPVDSQPIDTATTTAAPASLQDVQVTIDCARGELLSELDVDLSRVTFVPENANDETAWITLDVIVENPTVEWIQVDPGFDVVFIDADGADIVTQPWIEPTYNEGNRVGTIGTFERPLSVGASTTVTTELIGNGAYLSTDSIARCNLYAAVPTRR